MKIQLPLAAFVLLASSGTGFSAALDEKSTAPAWATASQAEKDQWVKSFKFQNAGIDQAKVAECLDDYAPRPLFATNDLAGVTTLCETVVEADSRGIAK